MAYKQALTLEYQNLPPDAAQKVKEANMTSAQKKFAQRMAAKANPAAASQSVPGGSPMAGMGQE